jgi:hypothetical protein
MHVHTVCFTDLGKLDLLMVVQFQSNCKNDAHLSESILTTYKVHFISGHN